MGLLFSPGYSTKSTCGCCSSHCASNAFSTWRSTRREKVSIPCKNKNELNGPWKRRNPSSLQHLHVLQMQCLVSPRISFSKYIPELQPMISFRRLCELWKLSVTPIIISCINNHPANRCTMTADPFCSRFNNNVCTPFHRAEKITAGPKCIIYNQWKIILFCQSPEFLKIRNIKSRISDCFQVNGLCIFIDSWTKLSHYRHLQT